MRSTTTRAAALAAAVLCLVAGALAAVAPTAAADSAAGDVTVTWPDATVINPDTTPYVIDVQGETADRLYVYFNVEDAAEELPGPGRWALDFPTLQQSGQDLLTLVTCPRDGWGKGCSMVSSSPPLDITRSSGPTLPMPDAGVSWPDVTALNPALTSYAPDITWDGVGSLYLSEWNYGSPFLPVRVPAAGSYPVQFPDEVTGGQYRFTLFECPNQVFDMNACYQVSNSRPVDAWRGLDVKVGWGAGAASSFGPDARPTLSVAPDAIPSVDVEWQISDAGSVVAAGAANDVPTGAGIPSVGPQPQLVEGRTYEYRATVSSDTASYGHLVGSDSIQFTWDSTPDAFELVTETQDARGSIHRTDTFYPTPDGYEDTLVFRAYQGGLERTPASVAVTSSDGAVVATRTRSWDGRDDDGHLVPPGTYTADVVVRDAAHNPTVMHRDVVVASGQVVRETWRKELTIDQTSLVVAHHRCGWLKRPARPSWPGSVGYYTRECRSEPRLRTEHRIAVPRSVTGDYGTARVSIVGASVTSTPGATLRLSYLRRGAGWLPATTIDANLGAHHGPWDDVVYTQHGPKVVWALDASSGRYDVKKVVVQVRYDVLR